MEASDRFAKKVIECQRCGKDIIVVVDLKHRPRSCRQGVVCDGCQWGQLLPIGWQVEYYEEVPDGSDNDKK